MKKLIAELPTLTALMEKEELIMYLVVTREAVSATLMTKKEAKQMPIYFVRRLQKWSIELGEYDIQYRPRILVKGQILTDFIVERPEDDSLTAPMEVEEELPELWTLFTDGSSCVDGSGAGLILTNPEGTKFTYALRFEFNAPNNEAEYEARIAGLRIAEQMRIKNLQTYVDSRLVANQVNGSYVLVEVLNEKSIKDAKVLTIVEEEGNTWMTPIYEYLTEEILPAEKKAREVQLKSRRKMIRECQDFQVHRPVPRNQQQKLTPITSPWPFYKLGIDIAGPFLEGPGKGKFLIVAMDYFTKWIERFTSIKHPQDNDLVERANRSLGEGVKVRLDKGSKDWIEEILHVLWAHRTMIKSSNRDTPFSLTYRTEVVISAEIDMPTLRTTKIDMVQNNEALKLNVYIL
ncbi:reverse transcriptase domain-containing protein [Tanacetum coccineum]